MRKTILLLLIFLGLSWVLEKGFRVEFENPFLYYREFLPDNPRPNHSCHPVDIPVSVYEPPGAFYCIINLPDQLIYRIGIYGYQDRIQSIRFNVNLVYGDLVGLYGRAERIQRYRSSNYYYWDSLSISAYGRQHGGSQMRNPILYVYRYK